MSIDSQRAWEQLQVLRLVTETTGALHDVQIQNLKIWPLLAAPHALRSEFTWAPETKRVTFSLTPGTARPPADLKARMQGLERSVQALLGPSWRIEVRAKGRIIYKTKEPISNGRPRLESPGSGSSP